MRRPLAYLAITACVALFIAATGWLILERIEEGNVYPAASSLRTDPLGSMMLWESLSALPGLNVTRDHSPVSRLPHGRNTTYLHLGGSAHDWSFVSSSEEKVLDQFLLEGGRLVVTLRPDTSWWLEEKKDKADASPSPSPQDSPEASPSPSPKPTPELEKDRGISLKEKWGLTLSTSNPTKEKSVASNTGGDPSLPKSLPWHGSIILKKLGPAWKPIYTRDGEVVVAEMKRGAGTVAFLTDSYLLSNEALVRDRQTALLVWLIGPSSQIVFDEAHHGIVDSPGLASMARQYGLTGAAFAFLAWVGLFLWKNSSSLSPRQKTAVSPNEPVAGRPSFGGFVSMLRRNIHPADLLKICWSEWEKTFSRSRRFSTGRKAAASAIVVAEAAQIPANRNAVDAYRRVHHALHHSGEN